MKVGFWSDKGDEITADKNWKKLNGKLYISVLKYLEDWDRQIAYKGWSNCRICKKPNGSHDHVKDGITYPSGYIHYIRDHNVVPDSAIIEAAKVAGY